ncbi:hypothetical protein BBR47_39390 [Brevibacillus brevis NBRC 100599]|uniref:Uncharacterized protein n=1 Tax=Brevibacillus brevis (strain 47 / JCM 6285 / NBRC 100599) TaxID=358681 RepID=C0ZGK7_BREBN|nr:hypothetical protein BBR47_39390 [Brevibacillus brevis NBRC 100599]
MPKAFHLPEPFVQVFSFLAGKKVLAYVFVILFSSKECYDVG